MTLKIKKKLFYLVYLTEMEQKKDVNDIHALI